MKQTIALRSFLLGSILLAAVPAHSATIIYQDDFSGANNADLFGTAPDIRPGTETWSGSTLAFDADGSVDSTAGEFGAWLPFTPATGNIYQLSGTINVTAGNWISLGFTENNPNNNFNHGSAQGYGNVIVEISGATQFFVGEGLEGQTKTAGIVGVSAISIILNATNANSALWTMAYSLNGTQRVAPTTVLQGAYPDIGNFDTIRFVGFSSEVNTAGQIDNFSLSIIPEPSSALLGALGMLCLLRRRRN
jgi:hypothetical protein